MQNKHPSSRARTSPTATRVAFIGAGNMASSLVLGLIQEGWPASSILAADPVPEQRERLAKHGIQVFDDNIRLAAEADNLLLAVKPQVMKSVLQGLSSHLTSNHLLISIAAGITLSSIQAWVGHPTSIVRCMPNTPALVGAGITALVENERVDSRQHKTAETILSAVGSILWVPSEADLDAVTAVSGSGPAYFFSLMENLQQVAEQLGLAPETARTLVLETAYGAALMARQNDAPVSQLRQNVTSPGGTTEAAMKVLERQRWGNILHQAVEAAADRSRQLAKELE